MRNQAVKRGCASYQLDGIKKALFMIRAIVDTIVRIMYIIYQIIICLFRLLLPFGGEAGIKEIMAELSFWFEELINVMLQAIKQLANMLFNLIFSTGPLGSVFKTIVEWLCKTVSLMLWIWNETGEAFMRLSYVHVNSEHRG